MDTAIVMTSALHQLEAEEKRRSDPPDYAIHSSDSPSVSRSVHEKADRDTYNIEEKSPSPRPLPFNIISPSPKTGAPLPFQPSPVSGSSRVVSPGGLRSALKSPSNPTPATMLLPAQPTKTHSGDDSSDSDSDEDDSPKSDSNSKTALIRPGEPSDPTSSAEPEGDGFRSFIRQVRLFITFQSLLAPNTQRKIVWDWVIVIFVLYNAFIIPWYIAFDTELANSLEPFDIVTTIAMAFDILLNFRTGFIDFSGNTVYDAKAIALRYWHRGLLLDVLGTFPFEIFAPLLPNGNSQLIVNVFKAPGILRATRLIYNDRIGEFNSPSARIGKLLFGFFYLAHLFGSTFFFVGSVQTGNSWITKAGLQNASKTEQYIASLYWALTTMVTVGYGDISATTTYEQAVVIPILMLSALIYATIFGNMAYAIETITSTIRRYQTRMDMVKEFIKVYELPPELQKKLFDYTNAIWNQNKGFETEAMLSHLPNSVKAEIMLFINESLVERVPLLKQCSDRFLEAIILRMSSQVCLGGDFIFKEGDKSREMYFIRSGTVEIIMEDPVTGAENVIATLHSFSEAPFFGEISLLLGETRTASARAVSKCVLTALSQHDFFEVLSMFPDEENSLRETAAARLQQDIDREQAALEKENRSSKPKPRRLSSTGLDPQTMMQARHASVNYLLSGGSIAAQVAAAHSNPMTMGSDGLHARRMSGDMAAALLHTHTFMNGGGAGLSNLSPNSDHAASGSGENNLQPPNSSSNSNSGGDHPTVSPIASTREMLSRQHTVENHQLRLKKLSETHIAVHHKASSFDGHSRQQSFDADGHHHSASISLAAQNGASPRSPAPVGISPRSSGPSPVPGRPSLMGGVATVSAVAEGEEAGTRPTSATSVKSKGDSANQDSLPGQLNDSSAPTVFPPTSSTPTDFIEAIPRPKPLSPHHNRSASVGSDFSEESAQQTGSMSNIRSDNAANPPSPAVKDKEKRSKRPDASALKYKIGEATNEKLLAEGGQKGRGLELDLSAATSSPAMGPASPGGSSKPQLDFSSLAEMRKVRDQQIEEKARRDAAAIEQRGGHVRTKSSGNLLRGKSQRFKLNVDESTPSKSGQPSPQPSSSASPHPNPMFGVAAALNAPVSQMEYARHNKIADARLANLERSVVQMNSKLDNMVLVTQTLLHFLSSQAAKQSEALGNSPDPLLDTLRSQLAALDDQRAAVGAIRSGLASPVAQPVQLQVQAPEPERSPAASKAKSQRKSTSGGKVNPPSPQTGGARPGGDPASTVGGSIVTSSPSLSVSVGPDLPASRTI